MGWKWTQKCGNCEKGIKCVKSAKKCKNEKLAKKCKKCKKEEKDRKVRNVGNLMKFHQFCLCFSKVRWEMHMCIQKCCKFIIFSLSLLNSIAFIRLSSAISINPVESCMSAS